MPRPPSAAQLQSQMRSAMAKAERQARQDIRSLQRQAEREASAAQRRLSQDVEREARASQRRLDQQAAPDGQRLTSRLQSSGTSRPRGTYTTDQRRYVEDLREAVDRDEQTLTRERDRDVFLCHAWADRQRAARQLYEALTALDVDVWFSEEDLVLGTNLPRALDRGIRSSRIGVVLVTPSMLTTLHAGGYAEQELGALLGTGRVVPVLHEVTYEELQAESPLLAARAGLATSEDGLDDVAARLADVALAQ